MLAPECRQALSPGETPALPRGKRIAESHSLSFVSRRKGQLEAKQRTRLTTVVHRVRLFEAFRMAVAGPASGLPPSPFPGPWLVQVSWVGLLCDADEAAGSG